LKYYQTQKNNFAAMTITESELNDLREKAQKLALLEEECINL